MYWAPVVVGLTGLACVSGAQERAIGDVLAGAPSMSSLFQGFMWASGHELMSSRRSDGFC